MTIEERREGFFYFNFRKPLLIVVRHLAKEGAAYFCQSTII